MKKSVTKFLCVLMVVFSVLGVGVCFASDEEAEETEESVQQLLMINEDSTSRFDNGESQTRRLIEAGEITLVAEPDMINKVGMEKQVRDTSALVGKQQSAKSNEVVKSPSSPTSPNSPKQVNK